MATGILEIITFNMFLLNTLDSLPSHLVCSCYPRTSFHGTSLDSIYVSCMESSFFSYLSWFLAKSSFFLESFFFIFFFLFFKILCIYSWKTERERSRDIGRGEAGSTQGAQHGTQSQDPRITSWAEGRHSTTEPPGHVLRNLKQDNPLNKLSTYQVPVFMDFIVL